MRIFFRIEQMAAYLAGTDYVFAIDQFYTAPLRKTPNSSAMIKAVFNAAG
jgi:hypothetical protein